MTLHYARDIRNGGHHPAPDGTSERDWHQDAIGDTHTSHTLPGRLYIVQCEWCPEAFAANTKAVAMSMFREHEDAMLSLHETDQKPAVPVDALGFPTEVGATFTAIPLDDRNETRRRFVVGNDGFDVTQAGIRYLRSDLDPASIKDVSSAGEVRRADGRNGQ